MSTDRRTVPRMREYAAVTKSMSDNSADATANYPPRSFSEKVRESIRANVIDCCVVLYIFFNVIWALLRIVWILLCITLISFRSSAAMIRIIFYGVLVLYVLAATKDPDLFETPQECLVSLFSLTCVCGSIFGTYKFMEWCVARTNGIPAYVEVAHLREATGAANGEVKWTQKRHKQAATHSELSDFAADHNGFSSSSDSSCDES